MSIDADARKAQIRAVFDRPAPQYDAVGPACFAHFGRCLVEEAAVGYGQRVLDVACGRGAVLFSAAERVGATGEVIGIDPSEEMVRATNIEAHGRGLSVSARVMDAEHLEFADATFLRVLCGFGLMFFPQRTERVRVAPAARVALFRDSDGLHIPATALPVTAA